jgi:type IV pilus assembly protein PilQ
MKKVIALWVVVVAATGVICAGGPQPVELSDSEGTRIDAIVPHVSPDRTRVELRSNAPLLYTSYRPDPMTLVLEIRNIDASGLPPVTVVGNEVLDEIRVETKASVTRVEFTGLHDEHHAVRSEGTALVVEFFPYEFAYPVETVELADTQGLPVPAAEPEEKPEIVEEALPVIEVRTSAPATELLEVEPVDEARVLMRGDGALRYESFTLENPDRLVINLIGVRNRAGNLDLKVNSPAMDGIRVSQFQKAPDQISRVVVDLPAEQPYRVLEHADTLELIIGEQAIAALTVPAPEPVVMAAPVDPAEVFEEAVAVLDQDPEPALAEPEVIAAAQPAPEVQDAPPLTLEDMAIEPVPDSEYVLFENDTKADQVSSWQQNFESRLISPEERIYTGEKISVNFVEADLKNVFLFFADFIGLNIVIDPEVQGSLTMRLNQVPWDQAFGVILRHQGLEKVVEGNVVRIATTEKLRSEAAQRRALKQAQRDEVDPVTFIKILSYAKAQDVLQVLNQQIRTTGGGQQAQIARDIRTNSIIITDIPSRREVYENLIDVLDTRTRQVSIEARIVETDRNFENDLGIVWGLFASADPALGTQTGLQFPNRTTFRYDVNAPTPSIGTAGLSLGNVLDSVTLDIALTAFENEGKVRILSSPKITTQNNQAAIIEQGTQIPVVTTTAVEINVQYISASLKLEVTPQITAEETVIMDVLLENNSPDFVNRVGDVPPIITEKATTQILVRDGSTAVIGGIFKLNEAKTIAGVPGLRSIPGLGWLFKSRSILKQNQELLVFITPRILKNDI